MAVYDGIPEALAGLRADGYRLILCTAKPMPFAREVVAHLGLGAHLDGIRGADLDGRHEDKADLIADILRDQRLDPGRGCMIGDQEHDTRAAAMNGLSSIGVTWGYGSAHELETGGNGRCSATKDHRLDLRRCVRAAIEREHRS